MLNWQRTSLMIQLLWKILPQANRQLAMWETRAQTQLASPLQEQALASLSRKRFHAQGAACYALLAPEHGREIVSLTVALQTISDYLDNLCDRMGVIDEAAFRRVHSALLFWHDDEPIDLYQGLTSAQDRGYLQALTGQCRDLSQKLPHWPLVQPVVAELLALYTDLQVYKHLHPDERVERLQRWHRPYAAHYPHLHWNEFAAACGSTLAVFALLASASSPHLQALDVRKLYDMYFPTMCAVHILLDYLIDEEEDHAHGELNFVSLYPSREVCQQRIGRLLAEALQKARQLPRPHFHRLLVEGLVAVYLSDPKARPRLGEFSHELLTISGNQARSLHRWAVFLRQLGVLQRH